MSKRILGNALTHKMNKGYTLWFVALVLAITTSLTLHANEKTTLKLSASIAKSCTLTRTGAGFATPDIATLSTQTGSIVVDFTINCNSPFKYSLTSSNGALTNTKAPPAGANSDPMLTRVNYNTTFKVALEDGNKTEIDQVCTSSSLALGKPSCNSSAGFSDSGTSVAINKQASLKVELDGTYESSALDSIPLMSGTFEDSLTLKVEIPL